MEEASNDDLELATKQGTIVRIVVDGTTYGGSPYTDDDDYYGYKMGYNTDASAASEASEMSDASGLSESTDYNASHAFSYFAVCFAVVAILIVTLRGKDRPKKKKKKSRKSRRSIWKMVTNGEDVVGDEMKLDEPVLMEDEPVLMLD